MFYFFKSKCKENLWLCDVSFYINAKCRFEPTCHRFAAADILFLPRQDKLPASLFLSEGADTEFRWLADRLSRAFGSHHLTSAAADHVSNVLMLTFPC